MIEMIVGGGGEGLEPPPLASPVVTPLIKKKSRRGYSNYPKGTLPRLIVLMPLYRNPLIVTKVSSLLRCLVSKLFYHKCLSCIYTLMLNHYYCKRKSKKWLHVFLSVKRYFFRGYNLVYLLSKITLAGVYL